MNFIVHLHYWGGREETVTTDRVTYREQPYRQLVFGTLSTSDPKQELRTEPLSALQFYWVEAE